MVNLSPYIMHIKANGTATVFIRITHNKVRRYISTNFILTKSDIIIRKTVSGNDTYSIRSGAPMRQIMTFISEYDEKLSGINTNSMDTDAIINYLTATTKQTRIDFIQYGRKVIYEYFEKRKVKTAQSMQSALNSFIDFCGLPFFDINDLTASFMLKYQQSLENTVRSKTLYPAMLRIILNHAKVEFNDEEKDILLVSVNPFRKYGGVSTKYVSKGQRAVTLEELRQIRDVLNVTVIYKTRHRRTGKMIITPKEIPLKETERPQLAHDVFMLSFYLIGMNEVDLFNATSIKGNIISYKRSKTMGRREDEAYFEVRIEPEAMPLVKKYRDKRNIRVFDFYQRYYALDGFITAVNKGLKDIKHNLTFYQGRHTWATIAVNDVGLDKQLVHECLNHVDEKMKITDKYVVKSYKRYWEANRQVLDYIR
ncbi:MAG: phage integrase SAM-like domain-containing protein [Lentimicrobiaceae bacterium]